jgi:hypothetical protein
MYVDCPVSIIVKVTDFFVTASKLLLGPNHPPDITHTGDYFPQVTADHSGRAV